MPQSPNVHRDEIQNQPEHTADAAAAKHEPATHLTAHEETVQEREHSGTNEHASRLTHGKAAAIEAEKAKH